MKSALKYKAVFDPGMYLNMVQAYLHTDKYFVLTFLGTYLFQSNFWTIAKEGASEDMHLNISFSKNFSIQVSCFFL